ncbi:hypothetical protein [Granulicella sp. 5B5]|uniref:hypothetical protein n=1 Tax=Granulicella sp. 5B5 TaxID=1617967 RepID=UPI0015F5CC93|nr:hypothetical protein [Granulicella sp. 5B5]
MMPRSLKLAVIFTTATAFAQSSLPPNYKNILSNPDVLVMHVHYAAHEFVPMHDHPAVPTLYVYLNNSGEIDIIHEAPDGSNGDIAHRPPTHAGAMRLAPAIAERHSIKSNSDTPSDFLRVEFQHLAFPNLPKEGKRIPADTASVPGATTVYADASLRITRLICPPDHPYAPFKAPDRSLLIALDRTDLTTDNSPTTLHTRDVTWLPASPTTTYTLAPSTEAVLVSFLTPAPTIN